MPLRSIDPTRRSLQGILILVLYLGFLKNSLAEDRPENHHWAFKPVQRPTLPEVKNSAWSQDDLDRFILKRLENEKLNPAPKAERRILLRRLSFLLTGRPPTPEDLKKTSLNLEQYVDSLIASTAFSEHWARHWLDHVRYRPMKGKNESNDPYRLWVMKSIQEDMPYDQFVKMQIAGDLMPNPSSKSEIHLDGMVAVRPFSIKNRHHDQLDLLGRTFMGLSLICARCHDHKHEPLARDDYYALQGIFESSRVIQAPYLKEKSKFDTYMADLAKKLANETRMKKELKSYSSVSQYFDQQQRLKSEEAKLNDPKQAKNKAKIEKSIEKQKKEIEKRLQDIKKRKLSLDDPKALEYHRLKVENKELETKWKNVYQFEAFVDQADPKKIVDSQPPKEGIVVKPGKEVPKDKPVPRRFPEVLAGKKQTLISQQTKQSGRLELAEWLSDRSHPITTRLMVNRIWYYMMGEGLTRSLSNFGHSGSPPSHPELLDYLSDELAQNGGSIKKLIRRIALSATFQQSSNYQCDPIEKDNRVKLFGISTRKRLEVESIYRSLNSFEYDSQSKERHRPPSIDMVREMNELFDGPNNNLIVPRRTSSITSLQALFFMNSEFVKASTEKIANRLYRLESDGDRIQNVFLLFYGRSPSDEEIQWGKTFLKEWKQSKDSKNSKRKKNAPPPEYLGKWQSYLQVLLATNEFLFVD